MRNKLLLSSMLLCAIWVAAQTYPSQSSSQPSSQSQTSTQTSSSTSSSNGNETTVTGCLSGSSGNYMLKDNSGNMYQLTGDTAKLSDHVGHTIQVKGTTSSSGSSSSGNSGTSNGTSGTSGSSSGMSGNSSGTGNEQTLNVTSFKHISSSCNSNR